MEQGEKTFDEELADLLREGNKLLMSMAVEQGEMDKKDLGNIPYKKDVKFSTDYESWYTLSRRVIGQIAPERLEDFDEQYKVKRRKSSDIDYATYTISDYLIGITIKRNGEVVVSPKAAISKMKQQYLILKSAKAILHSKLAKIREILQANIFDSELEAATTLNKNNHIRAAGAVCGVVLERHLKHVCDNHRIVIKKKHYGIADCNEALKNNDIIDVVSWRFIQHLADIRNLCDHAKEREPKQEEVFDLIAGVEKVIKTVF